MNFECIGNTIACKMAFVNLNNSYPRRFLLAWRSGRMCCALCLQRTDTFSQTGLEQHYRISHKTTKFSDNAVRDGVRALRDFVANETRENLISLSEQRSNSVSTCKICILSPKIIVLSTNTVFLINT